VYAGDEHDGDDITSGFIIENAEDDEFVTDDEDEEET
jgi:hypothetical protein